MFQYPAYPLAVYHVSGEFCMLCHASKAGVFDLKSSVMEVLHSMHRSGTASVSSLEIDVALNTVC